MATEPPSEHEARHYRRLMEEKGLRVSEDRGVQATLLGGRIEHHSVTGYSQGNYKVSVRLKPSRSLQVVKEAVSEEEARRIADKLRSLGFSVEVDHERVRATSRNPTPTLVRKAIEVVEERG